MYWSEVQPNKKINQNQQIQQNRERNKKVKTAWVYGWLVGQYVRQFSVEDLRSGKKSDVT